MIDYCCRWQWNQPGWASMLSDPRWTIHFCSVKIVSSTVYENLCWSVYFDKFDKIHFCGTYFRVGVDSVTEPPGLSIRYHKVLQRIAFMTLLTRKNVWNRLEIGAPYVTAPQTHLKYIWSDVQTAEAEQSYSAMNFWCWGPRFDSGRLHQLITLLQRCLVRGNSLHLCKILFHHSKDWFNKIANTQFRQKVKRLKANKFRLTKRT